MLISRIGFPFRLLWLLFGLLSALGQVWAQSPMQFSETPLGAYHKDTAGGFSQYWCAYEIEAKSEKEGKRFLEINGQRHGPYRYVSDLFATSSDQQHLACIVQKADGKYYIIVDGVEKWSYPGLGFAEFSLHPSLEGNIAAPQMSAPLLSYSPDNHLIWITAIGDNEALCCDGKPGPQYYYIPRKIQYINHTMIYKAYLSREKGNDSCKIIVGDTVFGPYSKSWEITVSSNSEHYCFMAQKSNSRIMVIDGREITVPETTTDYALGTNGELAYVFQQQEKYQISFMGNILPNACEKIYDPVISPDGKHIAFWGRKGNKWSVVTERSTYPGYDGYAIIQLEGINYRLFWGKDSDHLAYFARKGKDFILALDGNKVPMPEFGGFAFTNIVDEEGNTVGSGYMSSATFDEPSLVQCLLLGKNAPTNPLSAQLVSGALSWIETKNHQSVMVWNNRREGPYQQILSHLAATSDGKHWGYLIKTKAGMQVVLDGVIQPQVYQALYLPGFTDELTFGALGIKAGKIYRVAYTWPRPVLSLPAIHIAITASHASHMPIPLLLLLILIITVILVIAILFLTNTAHRERQAWKKALQLNTASGFANYLQQWPKGIHASEAHTRYEACCVEEGKAGNMTQ